MKSFLKFATTLIIVLSMFAPTPLGRVEKVLADNPAPVQTFYLTLPEDDGLTVLDAINTAANSPVETYFSISIGVDGALVYYDQHEDGYAADIANPTTAEIFSSSNAAGVQIWGNNLAADGCPPNLNGTDITCSGDTDDRTFVAGDVIIPYNAVPVPITLEPQSYVLDQFSSVSYSNNDGNVNWNGAWDETDDDDQPGDGSIYITGGELFFSPAADYDSISRAVDLTGVGYALLTFDLQADDDNDPEDIFYLEISSDGGLYYTILDTYHDENDNGSKSIDITDYTEPGTRIRFRSNSEIRDYYSEGWFIDNVQIGWGEYSTPVLFDGKDKIAASSSISMTRAIWADGSGTLMAFGHEMYPTAEWGTNYIAPVGIGTTNSGSMFEYSALSIMASQNNTTLQIDMNGDGDYTDLGDINTVLNEGGSYLVPGINAGDVVLADKPVQVLLVTGDIGSNYESRDMNLLPVSKWGSSYWSPVGVVYVSTTTTNTRLYMYNPTSNGDIHITCEKYGSTAITQPVSAGFVITTDLVNNQGAHCYASDASGTAVDKPISVVGTIDTDGQAADWSFTLYPDNFLTTEALVGLGLGKDPTNTTSTENGSPVWVTAACTSPTTSTYVYVDWDNDGVADPVDTDGDDLAESGSDNGILVNRLQSVRLFEPGADEEEYDQTGARVWSCTTANTPKRADCTSPGCLLASAWGQDPNNATPGVPGLDVGTSVPPLRLIEGTKTLDWTDEGDLPPTGVLNPGDQAYYNMTVRNSGTVEVDDVYIFDTVPAHTSYVPGTTEYKLSTATVWTPIPDNPNFPLDVQGGVLLGNLAPGAIFEVRFQITLDALEAGDYYEITNCDDVFTEAGSFERCTTRPVATRDWGDLPESFGTSAASNGPNHSYNGLTLGSVWDVEQGGQPTIAADGDNSATQDDEEGVLSLETTNNWLLGNGSFGVEVAGGSGCLNAWMDFTDDSGNYMNTSPYTSYRDGNFTKTGGYDSVTYNATVYSEHIIQNVLLNTGITNVPVSVPPNLNAGGTVTFYFRFRITPTVDGVCTAAIAPTGFIAGGEVEDYRFTLGTPTAAEATLDAVGSPAGVTLSWVSPSEIQYFGYNLYRSETLIKPELPINQELILAEMPGGLDPVSYQYVDTDIERGITYYYWLEVLDSSFRTLYIVGPAEVFSPWVVYAPLIVR